MPGRRRTKWMHTDRAARSIFRATAPLGRILRRTDGKMRALAELRMPGARPAEAEALLPPGWSLRSAAEPPLKLQWTARSRAPANTLSRLGAALRRTLPGTKGNADECRRA